jgi:hypothetical protein
MTPFRFFEYILAFGAGLFVILLSACLLLLIVAYIVGGVKLPPKT